MDGGAVGSVHDSSVETEKCGDLILIERGTAYDASQCCTYLHTETDDAQWLQLSRNCPRIHALIRVSALMTRAYLSRGVHSIYSTGAGLLP